VSHTAKACKLTLGTQKVVVTFSVVRIEREGKPIDSWKWTRKSEPVKGSKSLRVGILMGDFRGLEGQY